MFKIYLLLFFFCVCVFVFFFGLFVSTLYALPQLLFGVGRVSYPNHTVSLHCYIGR